MFRQGSAGGIGSGALQSILGGSGLSELTDNIGRASGLSGKGVSTMLGFVAPIVLGLVKKIMLSRGLDASGLSGLLAGQRSNIAAAMPETMRGYTQETYGSPRTVPPARVTETHSNPETEHHRSPLAWIVPLAILAGLLGLIWRGATRSTVQAGHDESGVAERTAREKAHVGETASADALKAKYQSVIDVAKAQGVQISNLTGQNGKLILEGTAPSLAAANEVWDEIKRVNPQMNDIAADIKVPSSQAQPLTSQGQPMTSQEQPTSEQPITQQSQPGTADQDNEQSSTGETPGGSEGVLPRAKPSAPESSTNGGSQTYVVKAGDTLSTISKQFYGNTHGYRRIFDANSSLLKNPNSLEIGQKLEIPTK
jgi:nucleoid-associated protein YgaU